MRRVGNPNLPEVDTTARQNRKNVISITPVPPVDNYGRMGVR